MKDIICEDCGHKESMHSMFGCEARLEDGIMCECSNSEKGVLVAHIAKLEAVVKLAADWRNNKAEISDLIIAIDELEA